MNKMKKLNRVVNELIINEQRLYDCTTEEEANKIKPLIEKNKSDIIKYSPFFDKKWYLNNYSDAKASKLPPHDHYLKKGWIDGNDPSPLFSDSEYARLYEDVIKLNMCPLLHYEHWGRVQNREIHKSKEGTQKDYKSYKVVRYIKRKIGEIINYKLIKKNKNTKILVILHLFYQYSFKEIKEYLKNLEKYNYDIIITYSKKFINETVIEEIKNFKPNVQLIECPNQGYDVGPFFIALSRIELKNYDIVIKLQSKGITNKERYVCNQFFRKRDWFINLFEGVIGPFVVHKTIDILRNNSKYGIVAAKNLIVKDPIHKQNLVENKMKQYKIRVPKDYLFVAGTCFAIKSELLQECKDLKLTINDFQNAACLFFSPAHTFERYICFNILNKGYDFYGNNVCKLRRLKWKRLEKQLYKKSGMRLLDDKRFILSDDYVYFTIEGSFIEAYSIQKIKLGDLVRVWLDKTLKLNETAPYQYLEGNYNGYQKYSEYHIERGLPNMTKERYDKLIKSINDNGFLEEYIISVNEENVILDGQHRACILLKKYGENHEINVLKIKFANILFSKLKPFSSKIYYQEDKNK